MLSKIRKLLLKRIVIYSCALLVLGMLYKDRRSTPSAPVINVTHPTKPHDLVKVSAMLLMEDSMGSSTVLRSGPKGSDLLTNDHVCSGAKKGGGLVVLNRKIYRMRAIKVSQVSDLCLVHVDEDLHTNIELADKAPEVGDEILTGGYPLSMPLLIQKGFVSSVMNIGDRNDPVFALVTSIIVQPGHSGTGVFNAEGKLEAVIMAFRYSDKKDSMGFGLAVPLRETRMFVDVESNLVPWTLVPYAEKP